MSLVVFPREQAALCSVANVGSVGFPAAVDGALASPLGRRAQDASPPVEASFCFGVPFRARARGGTFSTAAMAAACTR
jgi:hypothetical protein